MHELNDAPSRRAIIGGLAASTLCPGLVRAQTTSSTVKRLAILTGGSATDPAALRLTGQLMLGLDHAGWPAARLIVERRFDEGRQELARSNAQDMVAWQPDVIFCDSTAGALEAGRATPDIPIVFVGVSDPVRIGLIESFSRPGRNASGLTSFEPSHGGKWVTLLKAMAPRIRTITYVYNPELRGSAYTYFPFVLLAAQNNSLHANTTHVTDIEGIEAAVASAASNPFGALLFGDDTFLYSNRRSILDSVDRHGVPAIYTFSDFVLDGGLMAYSIDLESDFYRAATLVSRAFGGQNLGVVPVENPNGYLLLLNLDTARRLRLEPPISLLAVADRIIEEAGRM